ncbi:MAG: Hsp20/alpha crystallin family protein [Deltaproteobacteria bacterium]|jgi:HSP20 family molecular chaperone IbpA|nr:Hsp20/alpha crystallin family protein [Deltaproteobacteria bacterium]MBW2487953.1 Hsp20/alpha crystallin family protein [Deltaproteobacteria bacterium]
MADIQSKELKVRGKQEVTSPAEQTKPGLVFTPAVDIFETEKEITLLADMPGVKANDLTIDLRDNTLTLSADVAPVDTTDEQVLLAEYETGKYYRQFTLGELINQEKIDATLNDGVLRLTLPKIEKATPKKIAVKSG